MYATAATKAGPRKGRSALTPRVSPLRAFSAARSTRSSPGSATATGSGVALIGGWGSGAGGGGSGGGASTATLAHYLHEHATGQSEGDAYTPAFDPDLDWAFELAFHQDLDACSRQQASALEL